MFFIKHPESSSAALKQMNFLLDQIKPRIMDIKLEIHDIDNYKNRGHGNNATFFVHTGLPLEPDKYGLIKKNFVMEHTSAHTMLPFTYIQETGTFQLKCDGGRPYSQLDVIFIKKADDIPGYSSNDVWSPLIKNITHYNPGLYFFEDVEMDVYKHSKAKRIFLTPFAVITDVITSPIQLLVFVSWGKWGPR